MAVIQSWPKWLEAAMASTSTSNTDLMRAAGLSRQSLHLWSKHGKFPRTDHLVSFCEALASQKDVTRKSSTLMREAILSISHSLSK